MTAELARAVAEHRRLTDAYIDAERALSATLPPRRRRRARALVLLLAVLLLPAAVYVGGTVVGTFRVGSTWVRLVPPMPPANCAASNVSCTTADSGSRLNVTGSSRIYDGQGHSVAGITLNASNSVIQNFRFTNCDSNCIWVKGVNNVIQFNQAEQVYYNGDDIDCMRFFGDGTKILYNRCDNILVGTDEHGAHIDCMQTWASTSTGGGSSNITIEGNYCNSTHFHQCVMAEGPQSTDGGGGGPGVSQNWTIRNNFFQCYAPAQTVKLDDIDSVMVEDNNFAGSGTRAVYITGLSSGVTLKNNILGAGYGSLS